MSDVDRTPKPCHHKIANHQHGTYAAYTLDRCRCQPCVNAKTDYERDRRRQKAYGRWNGLIDAEPARKHVRTLMSQGMGWKRVAHAAGLEPSVVWKLLYGDRARRLEPSKRIRPATADKLLAVELDLADGQTTDRTGAVRRLQALVALGWSMSKLADQLGKDLRNFASVIHGRRDITVATDRAVRELFTDLAMQLPPQNDWHNKSAATRARNYARKHGWAPPLAWDDIDNDDRPSTAALDPRTALDDVAIERALAGDRSVRLTLAEKREATARWQQRGGSLKELERRTGWRAGRYTTPTQEGTAA
ncbi:helix-turn-helix domain containing protein [Aeromicrobium phragmitis]|uniref:Helix-turn-helix domain containing protein n=1 Tax=Aeromicrobium phragmitis TaxID=2478914 RepID=A0A3L8PLB4_9ACTN|nr:helix-turn-helix domain containing protein [Aeromicrobium phragmitis]RLV56040.1 helix-turn-helix domain containing protein [Aeromicrobium phragmitis]